MFYTFRYMYIIPNSSHAHLRSDGMDESSMLIQNRNNCVYLPSIFLFLGPTICLLNTSAPESLSAMGIISSAT